MTHALASLFPSRAQIGLPRDAFKHALAAASMHQRAARSPPKVQAPKVEGLNGFFGAALRVLRAVGLPEMAGPQARGATQIEIAKDAVGYWRLRLTHSGPSPSKTRERIEDAAEGLAQILTALGIQFSLRELFTGSMNGRLQGVSFRLA